MGRRPRAFLWAVILGLVLTALVPSSLRLPYGPTAAVGAVDPVIAAAGDIACDPSSSNFNGGAGTASVCRQLYTSDLLVDGGYAATLVLGDNQYYCGGHEAFLQSYDLSWGRVKTTTYPAVGNHEYLTSGGTGCDASNLGGAGYFNYFGAAAGQPGQGYYSYDIGAWHLVSLNSNCSQAGGCGTSSPQYAWLAADLAAHPTACTLAYWHIPVFSSGGRASSNMRKLWQLLYDLGADLVLSSHDHTYERFAPQTAAGVADPTRGLRSFIVGTGGANHTSITSIAANSEVRNASTYGVLALTLRATSYEWRFVPEAGKTFTDTGSAGCNGAAPPPDTTPPSAPTGLTATATSGTTASLAWTASTDDVGVASYSVTRNGSVVGSSTSTAFSDTGLSPATTYTYTVSAQDQANNGSAQSSPATITTPSTQASLVFTPVADTFVNQSVPTSSFGSRTSLEADGSPLKRSLMRFSVAGVGINGVANARLQLYCIDPSTLGGEVRAVTGAWSESTVTWNTSPQFGASTISSFGNVVAGQWYEVDVTSLVTGNGDVDLGLLSGNSNGADYTSREGTAAQRPKLVVTPRP